MKQTTRTILVLTLGMFLGLGLSMHRDVLAERQENKLGPLPLEELQSFAEIFGKVKSDYVEPVEDKVLIEYAIKGMLSGLDPHSAYLDPDSYREVRIGTEGEFGGLGIEVSMENGFVKVVSPIDDTPAQRAGLESGDLIIRINDEPVKGMVLMDAVKKMRGKPGTDIELSIAREGRNKPFQVTITRDIIKIRSVRSNLLEKGYGYVRISQFQGNTVEFLHDHLDKLRKESGGELEGLVLDLRNNPGGVLNAAVGVADTFLRKGKIVYTEGRVKDSQLSFNATPVSRIGQAPMVVLVNEGSASASEIVAGALQDHRRAVIMGTKTFGKGSVQTIVPVRNGAAVKITTARYYTPNGRSIQAKGIEPDVEVKRAKIETADDESARRTSEADLRGHLENDKEDAATNDEKPADKDSAEKKVAEQLAKDYQLQQALNLLKGVNIVRAHQTEGL
ncbi:MAG: S41 family peptidase [Gammaproteobacteria bacterium]|jgi:carboxyl-terminal processing protease|nr:S41 family peptidase [Gammaproteobacteria bacterium]